MKRRRGAGFNCGQSCEFSLGTSRERRRLQRAGVTTGRYSQHHLLHRPLPGEVKVRGVGKSAVSERFVGSAKKYAINRCGGVPMVEETQAIRREHPVLTEYLAIIEALLGSQSNSLYANCAWFGGRS